MSPGNSARSVPVATSSGSRALSRTTVSARCAPMLSGPAVYAVNNPTSSALSNGGISGSAG